MLDEHGKPYHYGIIWCSDKKGDLEILWLPSMAAQIQSAKLQAKDKDTIGEVALFTITDHITAKPKSWEYITRKIGQ